jgi:hypothetical protein
MDPQLDTASGWSETVKPCSIAKSYITRDDLKLSGSKVEHTDSIHSFRRAQIFRPYRHYPDRLGDRAQAERLFESAVNLKPDDDMIQADVASFLIGHFTF